MENLPVYIPVLFVLTTIAGLLLLYWTIKGSGSEQVRNNANVICFGLVLWLGFQAILALRNVYHSDPDAMPPKIVLFGIAPAMLLILLLFLTAKGRSFMDGLPLDRLIWIHVLRVPVELVLFWLFIQQLVPELMTFEGRNFDVFSGITAPLIAWFGFRKRKLSSGFILIWNFVCLGLLINIVVHALLSAPSPFQKLAFDQPNIAILYFPFHWLPTFIVPLVLFAQLSSIRQLLLPEKSGG